MAKRVRVKDLEWIFIGSNCNYNCYHCPYAGSRGGKLRDVGEILGEIEAAKERDRGILVYGGDIFEHPAWKQILRATKTYGGTRIIYTNASHAVFEDKAKIIAESTDYVLVYVPAHFSYAQTTITQVQGSFIAEEAGLINLRNAGANIMIKIQITRHLADEPHNYINWITETVGNPAGVWVEFPDIGTDRWKRLETGRGMSDAIRRAYSVKLVEAELAINLLLQEFGREVVVLENIPPCIIRDIDTVEYLWTASEYVHEPVCGMCKLKNQCKGILQSYRERIGHSRELHPIFVNVNVE